MVRAHRIVPLIVAGLAAAPSGATPLEDGVFAEINRARVDPTAYVATLESHRRRFRPGKIYTIPGDPIPVRTREGVVAVDEAIAAVSNQPAVPPVSGSKLLADGAADHVAEQGPRGGVGHVGPNGDRAGDRIVARGGGRYVAEIISYGGSDPRTVVLQLIVDDNVPGRGHRRVLFDPTSRFAGVACGPHSRYGTMCVIDFARRPAGEPG